MEEIIGTVIIDGITYLVKKGVDALGRKIKQFFRDSDGDGVPDSSEAEFWEYDNDVTDVTEYYEDLQKACDERWEYFSEAVYTDVPHFILNQFKQFGKNPLCLAITSCLLIIGGLAVLRRIIALVTLSK